MAKKKKEIPQEISQDLTEIEEITENAEDINIDKAEKNPLETKYEPQKSDVSDEKTENNTDQFIFAQLKVINGMTNRAKAKRLADRVLRNRKG